MLSRGGEVDEERASGMASGGGVAGEGSGPGILRCVSESVLILLGIWQETDTTVFMCESVVGVCNRPTRGRCLSSCRPVKDQSPGCGNETMVSTWTRPDPPQR